MERSQGSLPSNTKTNPLKYVKVIALRSGHEMELRISVKNKDKKITTIPENHSEPKGQERVAAPTFELRIPYPARLKKDPLDE